MPGEDLWEEGKDRDFDLLYVVIWSGSSAGEGGKMRDGSFRRWS